jgi:HlyD family secretion protein
MPRRRVALIIVVCLALGGIVFSILHARSADLILTGIVTTNDVIVSPQVSGQVGQLLVNEGDHVTRNQLLAVLVPDELQADRAYYAHSAEGYAVQVQESEAALRYQERQTEDQIRQAEATLATTIAQQAEAAANLSHAKVTLDREEALLRSGAVSVQDADQVRTAYTVAKARADAADKQVDAQRAALALSRANAEQVAAKRSALGAAQQQRAAAAAQTTKATVRLAYSELRAPIDGIVDVRAVRSGEIVNPGQPLITLINPDDLWIRADVEETYIAHIHLGDQYTVRLPNGEERRGTVIYRGADAGFATQRDVSRSKRDIKTFEIRLRVDNRDRALALGMTAYVLLPAKIRS